jgi:tripartite-type tricarboxylate transporter receptor subunit TctC
MNSITLGVRAATAAALCVASLAGMASDYPGKPVRMVVAAPAAGAVDLMGRISCEKFAQYWGQPCVVENRAGASGMIGIDAVMKSSPDGYTLATVPSNMVMIPSMYDRVPYDTLKDVNPVALVSSTPIMIGAHTSFGAKTFEEFISYAKSNPGKVNYTSCGPATPQHVAGEWLMSLAGIKATHIPYKGCAPAFADVLSGRIPVFISTVAHFEPQIKAGKLRGYAVTERSRTDFAPQYPTVAEAGFPGYEVSVWFGIVAPPNVPQPIIARLNADTNRMLREADVREKMRSRHYQPEGGTPEAFGTLIRTEVERYGKVIKAVGIKPD